MKFLSVSITALLPLSIMAVPVADETVIEQGAVRIEGEVSPALAAKDLFERTTQICQIIGSSSTVNCRTGPGTSYPAPYYVVLGSYYAFTCVKTGQCITLGGTTNCGWDYLVANNCYVNGHYTDGSCTVARLGYC